jgi:hypothetical protein
MLFDQVTQVQYEKRREHVYSLEIKAFIIESHVSFHIIRYHDALPFPLQNFGALPIASH